MVNPVAESLYEHGLNLQAVFRFEELPVALRQTFILQEPKSTDYQYIILLANGGSRYWQSMQQAGSQTEQQSDPVDNYFYQIINDLLEPYFEYKVVYPGNHFLPLQGLGKLAGWHHESPLGLGIHPVFGLWFAYRGVILSNTKFSPIESDMAHGSESPCRSCQGKPCIAACPANAVLASGFKVGQCSDYRLQSESGCQSRCMARLACPTGKEYRYQTAQMTYHYQHSLTSIKKYFA